MNLEKFLDDLYHKAFDKTYRFLKPKSYENLDAEIRLLESAIENMLIYRGNDWGGRGEIQDIKLDASIAAAEALLFEIMEKKASSVKSTELSYQPN